MKFTVKSLVKRGPRIGELTLVKDKVDINFETPTVMIHTQGGHIPHVTHEVFKLVSEKPQVLQIPLISMHQYRESIAQYEGHVSEFIGSRSSFTCITLHDPANLTKQGHHTKDKVPIFTKWGKVLYTTDMYMNIIESFKPDMYVLLSDGDTNKSSPQKRISKAVENTALFNKQCLERHRKSELLKNAFIIAPIAGGYCLKSRDKSIGQILQNDSDINGYLIDGLHNNGPEVEFLPFDEVQPVVEHVIDQLPQEKLKCVQGCWNPINTLKLVQCGVDFFDTSYCRILTERSAAMTFSLDPSEEIKTDYEINLRQAKYTDDFGPVMSTCSCLTCSSYSKAYIHHLLTVQELLGPLLIMIHNIHHMLKFFETIRTFIAKGELGEMEEHITKQHLLYHSKVSCESVKADEAVES